MALSLGTLTAYTEQNKEALITKMLWSPILMDYADIRTGIKSSTAIPVLDSNAEFQAGTSCGHTTSGTTSVTQLTLSTTPIKLMEQICPLDLEQYFTQKWLPKGARTESTSLEADIVNRKLAVIAKQLEIALFQGATTHTWNTNLKQFNGLIQQIDAASDEVQATSQADINSTTIMGIFQEIYELIPADALNNGKEIIAFCGWDTFRILLNKIMNLNLFHYVGDTAAKQGYMYFPGTNMKVVACHGLNANNDANLPNAYKDRIIATYADNIVIGTDLQSDYETLKTWYSDDDDVIKFSTRFRIGVLPKFTSHIVTYKNS